MSKIYRNIQKQYINIVSESLPASIPNKRNTLKILRKELNIYLSEHPDSTYEELCIDFGTPESYADMIIEKFSPSELLSNSHLKKRHYLAMAIVIALIIVVSIAITFLSLILYGSNNTVEFIEKPMIYAESIDN